MSDLHKIRQMLMRQCRSVMRVNFTVNAYSEVMNLWRLFRCGRRLNVSDDIEYKIMMIFAYHETDQNHVLLYYSKGSSECLLMGKVDGRAVNLLIPGDSLRVRNVSCVATYC